MEEQEQLEDVTILPVIVDYFGEDMTEEYQELVVSFGVTCEKVWHQQLTEEQAKEQFWALAVDYCQQNDAARFADDLGDGKIEL